MKITLDSFLNVIKQSGLIEADRLANLLTQCRATLNAPTAEEGGVGTEVRVDAKSFATYLVKNGHLTTWQAEKLLMGKHKGFALGKYKLLSLLGKGGMSSVYLAEHTLMKRRVAVKVLPHKRVNDASYLGRFHREAQAVASLDHKNIVRAFDVDHEVDKTMEIHFLVMEYVEGRSLQEIIAQDGPLDPLRAAEYIRQAAEGLQHAHENGLVHRDIKPGNLLVDTGGTVKLLDLGLARFFDDQESLTIEHDEKVLGTADYLAPEQAVDSHSVDHRADLYALGCTLYFLLTGGPPFTEGSLAQRLIAHQTKEPPRLSEARDDVPGSLDAIMRKLMAKKAEDRPQTAEDAARLLRNWLAEQNGGAAVATTVAPREQPAVEAELDDFFAEMEDRSGTNIDSSVGPASSPGSRRGKRRGRSSRRLKGRSDVLARSAAAAAEGSDVGLEDDSDSFAAAASDVRGGSAVTGHSSTSQISRRKDRSSPPWPIVAGVAAAVLLIGGVAYSILGGASDAGDDAAATTDQSNAVDSPTKEPVVANRPKPNGDTVLVSSDESAPFGRITDAVEWAKAEDRDGLTIELAAGQSFAERVVIDNSDFSIPDDLTIRSTSEDNPAKIAPPDTGGEEPLLFVQASNLTLENLAFDARGLPTAVTLTGICENVALKNIRVRGFKTVGVLADSITAFSGDRALELNGLRIDGTAGADMVHIITPGYRSQWVRVTNSRLIGSLDSGQQARSGVRIEGDADQIEVRNTVIAGAEAGIEIAGPAAELTGVRLVSNTLFKCDNGIVVQSQPKGGSRDFRIIRNLFAEIDGAEVIVESGFEPGKFNAIQKDRYENVSTKPGGDQPPNAIDLFGGQSRRKPDLTFASTDPASDDFLRSSHPSLKRGQGKSPAFIGAIAP